MSVIDNDVLDLLRQQIKAESDTAAERKRQNDIAETQMKELRRARVMEQKQLKIITKTFERVATFPDCLDRLSLALYGIEENLREIADRQNRSNEALLILLAGRSNGYKARATRLITELEREQVQAVLYQERRTLQHLEEQRAKYGIDAPVSIINQIEDARAKIEALEEKLK